MRTSTKLVGAFAVAGLIAAGGSAFTATGVTNNAGASQFVGGTVSQTVSGATLSSIAYTFADTSNTAVTAANLTFADDALTYGKTVTATLSGGTAEALTCTGALSSTNHVISCAAATGGHVGTTGISVSVA